MKICWDNLENFKRSKSGNLFDPKNRQCMYFGECKICGEELVGAKSQKFCSNPCRGMFQRSKLKGKKIGRLLVIEDIGAIGKGNRLWKCLCDCGEYINVPSGSLSNYNTKSCGCLFTEHMNALNKSKVVDLTGQKIGRLTAIKRVRESAHHGRSPEGNVRWWWQCDCGVVKMITGAQVTAKNAKTRSCGCITKERMKKPDPFKNYKGIVDNDLSLYDTYAHQLWDEETDFEFIDGLRLLRVKCANCEEWFSPGRKAVRARIRYLNGKMTGESRLYCSDECKDACPVFGQHKYPKGFVKDPGRDSQKEWRKLVLERDEHACVKCGSREDLKAHHIEGIYQNPIESADIDLGVTFCKVCEKEAHSDIGCRYVDLRRDMMCKGEGN